MALELISSKIEGVSKLNPVEVQVIPDMIEAGTFLMAGATLGDIKLIDVIQVT